MIGEGKALGDDGIGFIPAITVFIHQDSHHFRNGHDRMGIIELENIVFV